MNDSPSVDELLRRATALGAALRERANEGDALRHLPPRTVIDLHDAGLFRVLQPSRFGGYELPPKTLFDLQIALGRVCPSTAWVYGVLSVHHWQLGLFPAEAQDEVWGRDSTTLISSSYAPTGKIERVRGGYRLSGRWSFSSGCDHAQWVFLGGFVPPDGPDAKPDMRTFLLPRADYAIDDNWFTSGLKATGSKDIVVDGAFVAEHRTHKLIDGFRLDNPGNALNTSPVFRMPFGQIHVRSVSTPALACALGALDVYNESTASRLAATDQSRVSEDPASQLCAAECESVVDHALLVLHRNLDELYGYAVEAKDGVPKMPVDRRVRFRHESALAARESASVVARLFTQSGGRAVFQSHPLNRFFQDVHVIRAHYANNPEGPGRNFGRVLFGQRSQDYFV